MFVGHVLLPVVQQWVVMVIDGCGARLLLLRRPPISLLPEQTVFGGLEEKTCELKN